MEKLKAVFKKAKDFVIKNKKVFIVGTVVTVGIMLWNKFKNKK